MSSKQFTRFCKLSTYVKQKDPKFFDIFSGLCIDYVLKPVAGAKGVTLLYPEDAKYRQEIINAAYSTDPSKAIEMIKALIVKDFLPNTASFGDSVVNLLSQKIKIEAADDKSVTIAGGLKLVLDKDFVPTGHRTNMAVYLVKGKGRISTKGEVVKVDENTSARAKGGYTPVTGKKELHNFLAEQFVQEIGAVNNIYVKKVCLQLQYLAKDDTVDREQVSEWLGDDEFSDSYLLDMYCEKYHPNCFKTILNCLSGSAEEVSMKATKAKYMSLKKDFADHCKLSSSTDANRLKSVKGPMDIREKVKTLYGSDTTRCAKDLFIVFCNINRDLWQTDSDAKDVFKNFAYLASHIYTECNSIVSKEFDIARDLTLYGNLLKSDVFMFCPKSAMSTLTNGSRLPVPTTLPTPLDMKLFSLVAFINKPVNYVSGGDPESADLLKDL